jgi:hypothetical protein
MNKSGDEIGGTFPVVDPTTGGLAAADDTPAGVLTVNGVDSAAVVSVTPTATTGRYKWTATLPEGIAEGDALAVWIAAAVGTVEGGNNVWHSVGCTVRSADVAEAIAELPEPSDASEENQLAILEAIAGLPDPGDASEENQLAILEAIAGLPDPGEHAISVTVTAGGVGVQGVLVRAFDGALLVDRQTTGVNGTCTLQLDAGTYTIVATKTGYQSLTTTGYEVAEPDALPITLTALQITPSSGASFTTVYAVVLTPAGEVAAGETCTLQLTAAAGTDEGRIYHGTDSPRREAVSDAQGVVQWTNVPIGGKVKYWAGAATLTDFRYREAVVASAKVVNGVFALPSLVAG